MRRRFGAAPLLTKPAGEDSLSHDTEASFGCRDSSLMKALIIRNFHILTSLRGEQAFSWQSHGVALTACELRNGTWSVPFHDRARFLPREKVARCPKDSRGSETEGVKGGMRCRCGTTERT